MGIIATNVWSSLMRNNRYNRDLLLHDCDEFTKNYYMTKYKMTEDMLECVDVQVATFFS